MGCFSTSDNDDAPKGCCGKCCDVLCELCPNNWCGYWIGLGCCGPRVTKKAVMTITPYKERACTDVPCCLLLFGCIGAQVALIVYALNMGADPYGLVKGVDWMNVRCDDKNPMGELSIFPDLTHPEFQICAKDCSQSVTDPRMITYVPILSGVDLMDMIPMTTGNAEAASTQFGLDDVEMPENLELQASYCDYQKAAGDVAKQTWETDKASCPNSLVPQTGYPTAQFYKFCMPNITSTLPTVNLTQLADAVSSFSAATESGIKFFTRGAGDASTAWHLLTGAAVVSLILCYAYGWCVKKCGKVIVWVSLVTMVLGGGAAAFACIYHAPFLRESGWFTAADVMEVCGYVLAVITGLMAVGLVCLAERINVAAQVAAESARAMEDLPFLLLVPGLTIIGYMGYFAFWVYTLMAAAAVVETAPSPLPELNLISKCGLVQSFIEKFECEYVESGTDSTPFSKSHCNPNRDVGLVFLGQGTCSGDTDYNNNEADCPSGWEGISFPSGITQLSADFTEKGQGYGMMMACQSMCAELGCCGIVKNNTYVRDYDTKQVLTVAEAASFTGEKQVVRKMLCTALDSPLRRLGKRPDLFGTAYNSTGSRNYVTANGNTLTVKNYSEQTGYDERTTYEAYKDDNTYKYALLGHIFVLFYAIDFICYMAYAVKAGVFAEWYFAVWEETDNIVGKGRRKVWGGENGISHCPVCASCCRVTRFHMGSLAFGAFLIALVQIIQLIVAYIQNKMASETEVDESSPEAVKKIRKMQAMFFACLQCMLECLKDCIDRCNKNGIVVMSIYGTPFCSSGLKAFALVFQNLGRVAVLYLVQAYITRIGKICCALATTGLAFLVMEFVPYYRDGLSSYIFVAILVFLIAYVASLLYFNIYQTAIDTIFLCFLCDEEEGGGKANLVDPRFQEIVQEQADESQKLAARTPSFRMAMKRARSVESTPSGAEQQERQYPQQERRAGDIELARRNE